jgi:ketosteroid isomerase-like protein
VTDADEIRRIIRHINEAWLKASPAAMRSAMTDHFHADVVVRGPDFSPLSRGRTACIESYAEFAGTATVSDSEFADADVDVFGDNAIATYRWRLKYDMGGAPFDESGHEIVAFVRIDDTWQAIWRVVLTDPT